MRITADARHAFDTEVEGQQLEALIVCETCGLDKGHDERAQAAVDVHADIVLVRELPESHDVVLAPVGEVNCRPNELRGNVSNSSLEPLGQVHMP